jgi:hypothetical protein
MTQIKINAFDRDASQAFVRAAEAALQKVADDYGVTMETGTWRYNNGNRLSLPFVFKTTDAAGNVQVDAALVMMAKHHGIDITQPGYDKGLAYEIVAYNGRAPKNPWSLKRISDGKSFKAPTGWVKARFAIQAQQYAAQF